MIRLLITKIVESAPEYLKTIEAEGKDTDIVWRLRRQLPRRRSAAQSWVEHLLTIVVCQTGIFPLCRVHRSFIGEVDVAWCLNCTWVTCMELGRRVSRNNSSIICQGDGCSQDHRTDISNDCAQHCRTRRDCNQTTRIGTMWRNSWTTATPAPSPGVTSFRGTLDATPLLADTKTSRYRSCVGAPRYYVLDRADAQLEVIILGSYLRAPTTGAMEASRRVTRYLLGASDAFVKLH